MNEVEPKKDEEDELPVAHAWRVILAQVVSQIARDDFDFAVLEDVSSSESSIEQARAYIAEYGETLVELPEQTWETSIASWQSGHWEVLVDLWTEESGCSDMVMHVFVRERSGGYRFELHAVYVP